MGDRKDKPLSHRTLAEQARGRGLVELAERYGRMGDGIARINKTLPGFAKLHTGHIITSDPYNGRYTATVFVVQAGREDVVLSEPLDEFPSETLITQLALLAG